MIKCEFDDTMHENREDLHAYLRHLRIKQADYYQQFHPRFDILTKEPIPFKNVEQYFSQEFKDKNSLKKWIKLNPEKGKEWAINWLCNRKKDKGLIYAPTQVELRSLFCPSMPYYDSIGGYYAITASLGFTPRFTNETPSFIPLPAAAKIIEDTREQKALDLSVATVSKKVDEGDYALSAPYDKGVYVERKSLMDFIGTMSGRKIKRKKSQDSSLERFDRELARAAAKNHYIVMLVESDINTSLGFDHLPHIKRRTNISSAYVFKNLRDLLVKYPLSFQAVFADGRVDAAQKLVRIFEMGEQVRKIDLQNAVERRLL